MRTLFRSTLLAALLTGSLNVWAIGAIAVDDEVGAAEPGYGLVTGFATEREAQRAALKECRDAGNEECETVLTFKGCGAYAASRSYYGVGSGSSLTAAERKAIEACGNNACKVVVSDCE